MRYLLDTNIVSAIVRDPHGRVVQRIRDVGESNVCTSLVVAAELRFGAAKRNSERLRSQLEAVLSVLEVVALEAPVDSIYGELRARLERAGQPVAGNDLLIAAHALSLDYTLVTDRERELERIEGLRAENWLRD